MPSSGALKGDVAIVYNGLGAKAQAVSTTKEGFLVPNAANDASSTRSQLLADTCEKVLGRSACQVALQRQAFKTFSTRTDGQSGGTVSRRMIATG